MHVLEMISEKPLSSVSLYDAIIISSFQVKFATCKLQEVYVSLNRIGSLGDIKNLHLKEK